MTRSPARGQSAKDLLDDPGLLRTLLDGVPDHVYVKDVESRYVFNNAGHVKALGAASPEEVAGKTDFDFYPEELARRYRADEREILRSGRPLVAREEPSVDGGGNERWHSTTKVPLRGGNGEIVGLVGVTRDVTERKRAIEARQKSEAKFRAVFDRAAIGMALVDEAGRVAESNRALQEMLGYDDEELRGMHFADVTHPDDVAADAELFEGLVAGKLDHFRLEKRYIRKDGSMVWGHLTSSAVRTAEGEQWFMIGMVEDITERKRTEEALKESEERFRQLFERSIDALFVHDEKGRIVDCNSEACRSLGYAREELLKLSVGDIATDLLSEEEKRAKRGETLWERAIQSEPGKIVGFEENQLRRKDGTTFPVEVGVGAIEYNGRHLIFASARDVTKRKRAEEALKESEERYRAVMEQSVETIYLYDAHTKQVLESNTAFQKLIGYTAEELLGMRIYDFIDHDEENIDANIRRSLKEKRRHIGERRYRRKDGSVVLVDTSASVISYNGKTALCAVSRDVTERKRMEEALRKSEASLAEAQRMAHLGSWEWDIASSEVWWSDETYRIYGFEPKEFVPTLERLFEVIHPDDRDLVRRSIDAALYNDDPYDFEHRIIRPDGEERIVHRWAEVVRGEEGEPLSMIGTVHDITERKRAEQALRESEERHRAVVEQSVEAIYLFDPDSKRVLETNHAFEELIGYKAEELCEMKIYDFVAHEREDIDRNVRRHVIEERRFVGERRYRRKDGKSLEVEVSATLIPYHDGEAVCVVIRDVTERKALEEQLRHQAFHDPLTELPNRALFLDRLEHALARARREGASVAVLFVDLDDFKVVNDSLGHDAGNTVLVEVAERLRSCVRPGDTVGRIFGDEFALLLEAPASVEDAHRVTERIRDRLQATFDVKGREVYVSSSVGIATGDPARDRPDDLLRHADLAMFEAKSRGKGRYEVFVPSMSIRATERLDLERDLRRAVERDEFEVHYQPIIDLRTGEIVAFEALARWRHPERGLLAAADFIRLAEETGLIRTIGRLVLEEACRQAKEWSERHADGTPSMSVNLSASQFAHQPDMIPEVLTGTGLDPQRLQLEITERTVMHNAEFALGKLRRLKGLGVSFAIDDYGKGYSCLYYLKNMPVDSLKIDRAFITGLGQNPEDTAIVSGTISLGHALGLQVVAEGVESAEQLAELRKLGCDLAQGYHFAKPLPREAAERLLVGDTTW